MLHVRYLRRKTCSRTRHSPAALIIGSGPLLGLPRPLYVCRLRVVPNIRANRAHCSVFPGPAYIWWQRCWFRLNPRGRGSSRVQHVARGTWHAPCWQRDRALMSIASEPEAELTKRLASGLYPARRFDECDECDEYIECIECFERIEATLNASRRR